MGDPQYQTYPNLQLSQHIFQLTNPYCSSAVQQRSLQSLQHAIKEQKMAPLYRHLAHPTDGILNASGEGTAAQPATASHSAANASANASVRRSSSSATSLLATRRPSLGKIDLPWDEALYEELKKDNEKELEEIQREEDEATEKAGETEIQAARAKRAEFYAKVGDKVYSHSYSTLAKAIPNFWIDL